MERCSWLNTLRNAVTISSTSSSNKIITANFKPVPQCCVPAPGAARMNAVCKPDETTQTS